MKRHTVILVIVVVLFLGVVFCGPMMIGRTNNAFAQSDDYADLTFLVDGGNMYFYDMYNQTIYIYSSRGEFRQAFKLKQLGTRLTKINSTDVRTSSDQ